MNPTHLSEGAIALAGTLLEGLKRVSPAIPLKSSHPILFNVLIRAIPDQGLQLTAFNLKTGIQTISPAKVESAWELAVPVQLLQRILNRFPLDAPIQLAAIADHLELVSSHSGILSRYKLTALRADEYPALPSPGHGIQVELATKELIQITRSLIPAVAKDGFSGTALTNIFLRLADGEARFYAANPHQIVTQAIAVNSQAAGQALLPTDFLKAIRQYQDFPSIKLGFTDQYAYFDAGDTRIVSRLGEGKFPVESCDLASNSIPWAAILPVKPLKKAVERLMIAEKTKLIQLRTDFREQVLIVSCGNSQECIPAQVKSGSRARLNPAYLLGALNSIATPEALISLDCCGLSRLKPLGGDTLYVIKNFSLDIAGTWKNGVYTPPDRYPLLEIDPLWVFVPPIPPVLQPQPLEQLPQAIETGEAVEQLRKQLSGEVKTPMTSYVISKEEMQEAIIVSLRPDQAYEIICGQTQMIPYGEDLSKWIGRHIVVHAAPVEGEILESAQKGLRDMELDAEDAPMNHVLGYGIIADVKLYDSAAWDADFYANVHGYADPLSAIALSSESGKVYGVMVRRPILIADTVELRAQMLHEFWEPTSPAYTAAIREVFESDRPIVDVEKEVYPDLVESE